GVGHRPRVLHPQPAVQQQGGAGRPAAEQHRQPAPFCREGGHVLAAEIVAALGAAVRPVEGGVGVADGQQQVVGAPGQSQGGAARLAGQQLGLAGTLVEQVEVGHQLAVLGGDRRDGQLGAVGGKVHPQGHALGGGGAPGQQLVAVGVVDGQQGQL